MIHPLLRLAVSQPHLLAEHAEAYAGLVGDEVRRAATGYGARAVGGVVAVVMALLFLVLGGVSLMLWAVTPPAALHAPWALILTPAIPAVLAALGAAVAMKKTPPPFVELKQQFAADVSMIRQAGTA